MHDGDNHDCNLSIHDCMMTTMHLREEPPKAPAAAPRDEPEPAELAELGRLAKQAVAGEGSAAEPAAVPTTDAPAAKAPAEEDDGGAVAKAPAAANDKAEDAPPSEPVLSREEKAKAARERYLARKRKAA